MPVDTNALLSIGFSLITNFANIVGVPEKGIPHQPSDLQRCVVGNPMRDPIRACDLYLVHNQGSEFWIEKGAVWMYNCPGSYFHLQNPDHIPWYLGEESFSIRQLVSIATTAVARLAKGPNPITNRVANVTAAGLFEGKTIPFTGLPGLPRPIPLARTPRSSSTLGAGTLSSSC